MKNGESNVILHGNIWKLLLHLSAPGIAGMLLISLNGITDAFFVSHLIGEAAFTGVSLTLPLLVVNSALTSLLSSGSAILYSRMIGKQQTGGTSLFTHLLLLTIIASVLLALYSSISGKWLLRLLGADNNIFRYGWRFYITSALGCFPSMLGLCVSGLIRAGGHLKKVMQITGLTVVLNVLLNPVFIRLLHLGTAGAALASVTSMSVYALLTIRYFIQHNRVASCHLHFQWQTIKDVLLTGLPAFFMQLNGLIRQFILFKLVTITGSNIAQVSFFAAVYRLFSFAAVPVFGVLQALQPVLGINYGAGNYQRMQQALKVFRLGAVALMLVTALPGWILPRQVLSLLLDNEVLDSVSPFYFSLVLIVLPLMPFASTGIVLLQATGQRKTATLITFSRELVLFIPVLCFAVYVAGYNGIYYGLLAENLLYSSSVLLITGRGILKKLR